jgi:hypothetical protein
MAPFDSLTIRNEKVPNVGGGISNVGGTVTVSSNGTYMQQRMRSIIIYRDGT